MKEFMSDKKNIIIVLLAIAVSLEFAFIFKLRQDVNNNFKKIESLTSVMAKLSNDVSILKQDVLPLKFNFDKANLAAKRNAVPDYDYEKHDMQKDIKDLQDELADLKDTMK